MAKKINLTDKPVQYFNEEYLRQCQAMTLDQIVKSISDQQKLFWSLQDLDDDKSILISLKVPKRVLKKFKELCENKNLKYQSQIKQVMIKWILESSL